MADAELFERYRNALDTNARLARDAVEKLVAQLDGMDSTQRALFLAAHYPELVRQYGSISAEVTREYYQESRDSYFEDANDGGYVAQPAQEIPERWALEDVLKAAKDGIATLPGVGMRRVMQRSDFTVTLNARRDPASPRWAFVPHVGACPWCLMIGSRGFEFRSEQTAAAERHANCACGVAVDFDRDNPALDGYDPEGIKERLLRCGELVGDTDWDTCLMAANWYFDREWIRTGKAPEVGYDSPVTKALKESDPAHALELGTARILASHGLRATFWQDELHLPNQNGKGTVTVGRPDLDTGVEIKTLYKARSENTFSKHISNAKKKDGLRLLVLDVSGNDFVDDRQAVCWIESGIIRHKTNGVVMIDHDGSLRLIK